MKLNAVQMTALANVVRDRHGDYSSMEVQQLDDGMVWIEIKGGDRPWTAYISPSGISHAEEHPHNGTTNHKTTPIGEPR